MLFVFLFQTDMWSPSSEILEYLLPLYVSYDPLTYGSLSSTPPGGCMLLESRVLILYLSKSYAA